MLGMSEALPWATGREPLSRRELHSLINKIERYYLSQGCKVIHSFLPNITDDDDVVETALRRLKRTSWLFHQISVKTEIIIIFKDLNS